MQWDDFLPHVLPYVGGCPDSLAVDHVIKAARTFCAETRVWSYEADSILSGASVPTYALQIGEGEELVRVLNVSVGGRDFTVLRGAHGRAAVRSQASREYAFMSGPLSLTIYPTPAADDVAIVADIAVKPAVTCAEWPDDLAEHVADIAHGAIWTLCQMPRVEWRDAAAAAQAGDQFAARIASVKADVERGYGRASRPAVSRYF